MDNFCLIFINTISLLLFFIILVFWKNVRKQFQSPEIFDLVAFFVSVKIILYFLLPAVLRGYSDWAKDREIGAMPGEITTVYAIEFISYSVWIFFLLMTLCIIRFGRPSAQPQLGKRGMIITNNRSIITEHTAKLFMIAICIFYCFFTFEGILKFSESEGNLIQPIVMLAGPVVGVYLFSLGKKQGGNIGVVLGIIVTIMSMLSNFAGGGRGQVVAAALWMFFLYLFVTRKKYILYLSIAGLLLIFSAHNVMINVRHQQPGKSFDEKVSRMTTALSTERDGENIIDAMDFRFGEASRVSVGFLRLVEEGNLAGFNPIISSAYALIPRKYSPDKPQQGSFDGTKEGMGMYIVQSTMRGASWNMSDFFTGVHAYWELGLPGVFLFSALSGIFIALCIGYFGKFGLAGLPLMMIVLKPPWLEPKLWIAETIADFFHTLLPLIFLWYLIKLMTMLYAKGKSMLPGIVSAYAVR